VKAVLYIRISTDKQEADNQELQLRSFCSSKGWSIEGIFNDVISGKETSRPAFDLLFQNAHQHLFDVVVFWDLSRFSRAGVHHTLLKLKELENLGIDWISYQEQYISSLGPWKDVVISIFSTLSKLEREKISERTKAGLERAKNNGTKLGRPASKMDFPRIWKEFKAQGSINKTAKVLPWSYGTVHRIITNNLKTQEEYDHFIELSKKGGSDSGKNSDVNEVIK